MMNYHTSYSGICFIAKREALVMVAYPDGDNFSIGFGHNNPKLKAGDLLPGKNRADRVKEGFILLAKDLTSRENIINSLLTKEIAQYQFDALMSLFFNAGSKPLKEVVKDINDGFIKVASNRLMLYIKVKNKDGIYLESEAIEKRRDKERTMFRTGDYGDIRRLTYL